ncbi:MAG: hypothetical protein CEE40_02235 [Chloroflexi bacterium B3_Chlor]|nr:MAG: hypothetical protein CEE40_02235 [Chloroflexi bacterium B3_Chlor]
MPIGARDLEHLLVHKFSFERIPGKKHGKYGLFVGGKRVATTYLSGLTGDIDDTLLGPITKQIFVTMNQFKGMKACSIELDAYLAILRERGRL